MLRAQNYTFNFFKIQFHDENRKCSFKHITYNQHAQNYTFKHIENNLLQSIVLSMLIPCWVLKNYTFVFLHNTLSRWKSTVQFWVHNIESACSKIHFRAYWKQHARKCSFEHVDSCYVLEIALSIFPKCTISCNSSSSLAFLLNHYPQYI